MNLESLTFNQQVGAVIRYTVKPEATREALQRHPLFNLVATCPTHLTLEERWFNLDRDVAAAKASRSLVVDAEEVQTRFGALGHADLETAPHADVLRAREIDTVLRTRLAGRFQVSFPAGLTEAALDTLLKDRIPFERLSARVKSLAAELRGKAGELVSLDVSYVPVFS